MEIKTTFYKGLGGQLVRRVEIDGKSFVEQFDWDGWYGYYAGCLYVQLTEEKAVEQALKALQVVYPNYQNPGRARFKLYAFDLSQITSHASV